MTHSLAYPTAEHERAAQAITQAFARLEQVEAVLLVGSCARGKASRDSCLDVTILVSPDLPAPVRAGMELHWRDLSQEEVFRQLRAVGRYSNVDLDFCDGRFLPNDRGWTDWPDEFELDIGNALVYSAPLWDRGQYLARLKERWLPYYGDGVRQARLAQTLLYCRNNLDHVRLYVGRGLHFQAFFRLAHAFQEFLQALFISRRTYPVAYDKWIREQVVDILAEPGLYSKLVGLFEVEHLESAQLADRAAHMEELVQEHIVSRGSSPIAAESLQDGEVTP